MTVINLLTCAAFISGLALPIIAQAQTSNQAAEINICSQISQDKARLTCFDALSPQKKAVVSAPVTSEKVPLTEQQLDDFGNDHVEKTKEELAKEINTITLTISKLTKTVRGQWKIIFENGQKWQQKDTAALTLSIGSRVILTKGAFGSVYLKKENTKKRIKVKRLQ